MNQCQRSPCFPYLPNMDMSFWMVAGFLKYNFKRTFHINVCSVQALVSEKDKLRVNPPAWKGWNMFNGASG